ncbi:MAG: hypothetical protein IPL78_01735 [Chloroflexi bacterium]|nr:hypothetical protein [Chloroflexota bacterium]
MPTITVTKEQVVELVKQLPPTERRLALFTLAEEAFSQRKARMVYAESQLRRQAFQRGRDWDQMADDEKERFVDDLLHEA